MNSALVSPERKWCSLWWALSEYVAILIICSMLLQHGLAIHLDDSFPVDCRSGRWAPRKLHRATIARYLVAPCVHISPDCWSSSSYSPLHFVSVRLPVPGLADAQALPALGDAPP